MSQRRPNSDSVQIRLDVRALWIGGGVLAALTIFLVAFFVGRMLSQPATPSGSTASVPVGSNPPIALGQNPAQAPGAQAPTQLGGKPSDTPVPVPLVRAPAGPETPIGDNPRLALPELKTTNYIYDFGEIAPTAKVEKTIVIKNDGTKPLEIKDVKSS